MPAGCAVLACLLLLQLHECVEKARTSIANLDNASRQLIKQAEMCAPGAEAIATSLTNPARGMEQVGL